MACELKARYQTTSAWGVGGGGRQRFYIYCGRSQGDSHARVSGGYPLNALSNQSDILFGAHEAWLTKEQMRGSPEAFFEYSARRLTPITSV